MFLSKKQIVLRILIMLFLITFIAAAAYVTLYYSNIRALNTPESYKGIFI